MVKNTYDAFTNAARGQEAVEESYFEAHGWVLHEKPEYLNKHGLNRYEGAFEYIMKKLDKSGTMESIVIEDGRMGLSGSEYIIYGPEEDIKKFAKAAKKRFKVTREAPQERAGLTVQRRVI